MKWRETAYVDILYDDNYNVLGYVEHLGGRYLAKVWFSGVPHQRFDDKETAKAWLVAMTALEAP